MTHTDLLIHVDTLGHVPSSAVLGIGALAFNIADAFIGPAFYIPISRHSNAEHGRTATLATMDWWDEEAPYPMPLTVERDATLRAAFLQLYGFFAGCCDDASQVWLWDAPSTGGVLLSVSEALEESAPWPYHMVRSARSFCSIATEFMHGHPLATPMGSTPEELIERRAKTLQASFKIYVKAFDRISSREEAA